MAILETRVISGRGLLRLNAGSNDYKKAKIFTLYIDVIRRPRNEYLNITYNEPQSRYGVIRLYRGGYCVRTLPVETLHQAFDFYYEPSAQSLYAIECAYAGILQTFFNLGNALALPSVIITDHIKDWNHVDLMWDEAKVVCYADTGLRLSVRTKAFDLCPEQTDKEPDPPPPPPEDKPVVPPGTPLNDDSIPVSPAYDEDSDDGETVPYPDDMPPLPSFPQGSRCAKYIVAVSIDKADGGTLSTTLQLFGEITKIEVDGDGIRLIVGCYGEWLYDYSACPNSYMEKVAVFASAGLLEGTLNYTITPL
jgi:hypothetical protein